MFTSKTITLTIILLGAIMFIPTIILNANAIPVFSFEFGSLGLGPGEFRTHKGVTTDSTDRIIVADGGNNRIQVFDSTGAFQFEFGNCCSRPGQFRALTDVATDSNDRIIVADTFNNRIQVFDSTGAFQFKFGNSHNNQDTGPGDFDELRGVAIDSNDRIIVADTHNSRIQVFDSTGAFQFEFGSRSSAPGQFFLPAGVTTDSNDRIIVADTGNSRIQVFDSTGAFQFEFGSFGLGPGQFDNLLHIATDSNDRIIVADSGNNRIQVFDSTGAFQFEFGSNGPAPGQFTVPFGVAIDSNDRIIVADVLNRRIQVFAEPPDQVTGLTATATGTSTIDLSWTVPADNGSPITGYQIERESPISDGFVTIVADTGSTLATFSDTLLTAGTQYNYRVSAISAIGTGPASNEADATTFDVPDAPTSLTAIAVSLSQIDLSWIIPADNGSPITGYQIERESPIGGGFVTIVADTGSTLTTFIDTGLTDSTQYNYRVSAINAIGTGPASNEADATTQTPQEAADDLIDDIQDLIDDGTLNGGQGNALTSKLQNIIDKLNNGKTNAACNQLGAFINQVTDFIDDVILTDAEGQPLIGAAQAIKDAADC